MSSQLPVPTPTNESVPTEEQYVEIPDWHREILDEAMKRYREVGMEGTPWEEFEKELNELIEQELENRKRAKKHKLK